MSKAPDTKKHHSSGEKWSLHFDRISSIFFYSAQAAFIMVLSFLHQFCQAF
jgi:hypothetical protein